MTAIHPGMTDRTNSNIARDGAPKRAPSTPQIAHGMKHQVSALTGVSPANPGVGPDADPANPLATGGKQKHPTTAIATSWGMKGKHDAELGKRVLNEAENLGR